MNIEKLEIRNFLTIGEAKLELSERGLLLIQGENADDPSASSNGAGKSSVVDAICWGLYGVTARGLSTDAVVNNTAKKNCHVGLIVVDGDKRYRINRYRKDATHKNQVFVHCHDTATGTETDLSKGTDRETQEVINALMGCSLDVFMASVYAGQERMPDLPGMTDKTLKVLIEEAAGVEVLSEAYTVARNRHTAAKSTQDSLVAQNIAAVNDQVRLDAALADAQANAKVFEDGRRDRAKSTLSAVVPINAAIKTEQSALAAIDEPAIRSELADCDARLASFKVQQDEHAALLKAAQAAQRQADSLKFKVGSEKASWEQAKAKLANIDSQVGQPCGECGKAYCEHDLEVAHKTQADNVARLAAALKKSAEEAKTAAEAAKVAQDAADAFKTGMTDVTAVALRQRELTQALNEIAALQRSIQSKTREVEQIKQAANAKLTEPNPWSKVVESKQEEVKLNAVRIASLAASLAEAEAETNLLADAVKVFGPGGVRAHILDTVTPFLNDRTRDYLGALSDGNIHAVWSTLSKTAKGELREKFNIEVTNDMGGDSFAALSGGEKRKVRLATALAMQDLVASRATKPVNIFVGDEIDHALDEPGLERLMGLLERKAKERGTVLIISHNSLSDWCDQIITVTKRGRVSTVDGAIHAV